MGHTYVQRFLVKALIIVAIGSDKIFGDQNRTSYIAAVVEYQPVAPTLQLTAERILELNTDKYVEFVAEAKIHKADIIVFPEYGLTSLQIPKDRVAARSFLVSIPDVGKNPCYLPNSSPILRKISCAAKDSQIYVVVNLGELQWNSGTKSDKSRTQCRQNAGRACHFNTNVVFNRNGEIIAKYYKFNLYFEKQFDAPLSPQYVTFDTDFGVTFGTFICFDLMFEKPAIGHVRNGIQNFVVTTAWVDELPFLTAIQSNTIWATSANSNLLVSGYHQPSRGTLGSGIFSGSAGPLNYTFDPMSGSRVILAEVPVLPYKVPVSSMRPYTKSVNQSSEFVFLQEDLANYSSVTLNMKKASYVTVCHSGLCCYIKYAFQKNSLETTYNLVAFSGTRKTARGTAEFGWEVCGIIRCTEIQGSCAHKIGSKVNFFPKFRYLQLTATGMSTRGPMAPSLTTLDTDFQPIPLDHFSFTRKPIVKAFSTRIQKINVQTIALVNRIYKSL